MFVFILMLAFSAIAFWLVFAVSILAHELGHAWAYQRMGAPVEEVCVGVGRIGSLRVGGVPLRIGLLPVFGYVKPPAGNTLSVEQHAKAAAAGPIASLLFGLLVFASTLLVDHPLVPIIANINFAFALYNLVPLPPMDGYSVLRGILGRVNVLVPPTYEKILRSVGLSFIFGSVVYTALVR